MNNTKSIMNDTVINTPEPRACSTQAKKANEIKFDKPIPRALNFTSQNDESLGILSTIELSDMDYEPQLEIPRRIQNEKSAYSLGIQNTFAVPMSKDMHEQLRLNREKANATLNKISHNSSLKLKQLDLKSFKNESTTPSWTESTVNEADLLRQSTRIEEPKMSDELSNISHHIRHSDISIREIVTQYKNNSLINYSDVDSAMFVPAEEAAEKLLEDEISWRNKHELPKSSKSITINESSALFDGKMSFGEFFKGKSDDASSIFHKISPIKGNPIALINSTAIDDSVSNISLNDSESYKPKDSILTISQIQNIIASSDETPNKIINKLHSKKSPKKQFSYVGNTLNLDTNRTSLESPNTRLKRSQKFSSSATDLSSSNRDISHVAKMIAASSMGCLCDANKENDRTLSSVRSNSSMGTIPEGKLPIECTKLELIWGCIKLGKSSTQEFVVRNRYQKRLRFQISSSNPSFRITKIDSEPQQIVSLLLHPMESRQITVTFMPTNLGPQVGKLNFYPILKGVMQQIQKQTLMLYGYGGNCSIEIQSIAKDASGKLWLSFGNIENKNEFVQEFKIRNNGTIPGFASFKSISKNLCSFVIIDIQPSEIILLPGEIATINIKYIPSKKDYKSILTTFNTGVEVFEISQIRVISGPEIIRQRIKRLCARLHKEQLQVESVIQELSKNYVNEVATEEMKLFRESISATNELMHLLNFKDISLTLEQDLDKTLIPGMDGVDETSVFRTLVNNPNNTTVSENPSNKKGVTVEPVKILLTPPFKASDSILITSESSKPIIYKIKVEPEGLLDVSKRNDCIEPGKMKIITLSCAKPGKKSRENVKVVIITDENVLEVDVKILHNLQS